MRFLHAFALSLPAIALAIFPVNADQDPLLRHGDSTRAISAELFTELEEFARIVDIAYCVGMTSWGISKPFKCLSRCSEFPDFELVTTWNTGPLLSDSCGYIALDRGKRRIVVAFRGTYSIANTVVDLSTIPQEYLPYPGDDNDDPSSDLPHDASQVTCSNCTVHMGFYLAWRHTKNQILPDLMDVLRANPDYKLHLVGHSLGGAVAALGALELNARGYDPVITTFGEPRVGNKGLMKFIDDRFNLIPSRNTTATPEAPDLKYRRITHINDPVPLLPLSEWGFAMHAGEIFISKGSLSPDISDLKLCVGDNDQSCIAGQDSTTSEEGSATSLRKRDLLTSVEDEVHDVIHEPWGIPSRYKLWQLFFAHRDYFWRIGLCVPGGDSMGGGDKYGEVPRVELR